MESSTPIVDPTPTDPGSPDQQNPQNQPQQQPEIMQPQPELMAQQAIILRIGCKSKARIVAYIDIVCKNAYQIHFLILSNALIFVLELITSLKILVRR